MQDIGYYWEYPSETYDSNGIQPCMVTLDLGRTVAAGDEFLGEYAFEYGFRLYDDSDATTFQSIGSKEFTGSFEKPKTDLAELYEEKD